MVSIRGVVANVLDCDIVVSKFDLQSLYYIHFRLDGSILWHINPVGLFNAISFLCIYINYIWFVSNFIFKQAIAVQT